MLSSICPGLNCKSLNINTGYVTGVLAISLKAEKMIVFTDIDSIYYESKGKFHFLTSIDCREIGRGIFPDAVSEL